MGLTVSSLNNVTTLTRPGSAARANVGTLDGRLSVSDSVSRSSSSSSLSPQRLSSRKVTLELSSGATSVNTREDLTKSQANLVNELLEKAREIKREADPTRAQDLADDAAALISSGEAQFTRAVSDDPTITSSQNVQVTEEDSDRTFTTSISGVSSLSTRGVDSSLSFDRDNIDDTIETLENAQASLQTTLAGFNSSRTDISAEVAARATQEQLVESGTGKESIEEVANRLSAEISSSTERLLANKDVDKLNVEQLLADEVLNEDEDEDKDKDRDTDSVS